MASSSTAAAFTAAFGEELPALHLLRLELADSRGKSLSRNTYWRYREPADMRALNEVRPVKVTADLGHVSRSGDRRTMTVTVRNRGAAVASMLRLSLLDAKDGRRVLPTLYGDNYLWLLPGESRTVTLSWPAKAPPSGRPALRIEGYNSAETVVRA